MKIGRYQVPTALVVGGVAGVGVLVLGQRLTGDRPTEAAPAGAPGDVPGAGAQAGDPWGDSEVGQFPSFPATGGGAGPVGGYDWWDSEAPPPSSGPINVPTTPTTPPPSSPAASWYPAALGSPPAGTSGYISVNGTAWYYRTSGAKIIDRSSASGKYSAFVSGPSSYTWAGHGTYSLLRILSGSNKGRLIAIPQASVAFRRKP